MPGDPKECRRQANECRRLAQEAATHRLREDFAALAITWLKLAVIFEEDDAVLKSCGDTQLNVVPFKSRRHRPIRVRRVKPAKRSPACLGQDNGLLTIISDSGGSTKFPRCP